MELEKQQVNPRLTDSFSRNAIRMFVVLLITMIFQSGFNLVDMMFVGMTGPQAIAAVSLVFPVLFFFITLGLGIGSGISSCIARAIGSGDMEKASTIGTNGIVLGIIMSTVISILCIVFTRQIFQLLGATSEVLELVVDYASIIFLGFIFLIIGLFCNSIMRGEGNMRTPMKLMVAATVLNIVLDPILIFGLGPIPPLGIRGAAIATVAARSLVVILAMIYFYSDRTKLQLSFKRFRFDPSIIQEILQIGIPTFFTQFGMAASSIIYMKIAAGYGPNAAAVLGIGSRIRGFAILPAFAMGNYIQTIVGQNLGARDYIKAKTGAIKSTMLVTVFTAAISIVLIAAAEPIIGVFTKDSQLTALSVSYFYYRAPAFAFLAIALSVSSIFRGSGTALPALIFSYAGVSFGIVAGMILSYIHGLDGLWLGISMGTVTQAILALLWFKFGFSLTKTSILAREDSSLILDSSG